MAAAGELLNVGDRGGAAERCRRPFGLEGLKGFGGLGGLFTIHSGSDLTFGLQFPLLNHLFSFRLSPLASSPPRLLAWGHFSLVRSGRLSDREWLFWLSPCRSVARLARLALLLFGDQ